PGRERYGICCLFLYAAPFEPSSRGVLRKCANCRRDPRFLGMYEKFYRLSGSPFKLTPDHRFFYRSAGHKKAMSYLQFGIHQGEGFIVVTGNVGTGKSTLVRQLFAELDTSKVVASQIVTTQIEAAGIVQLILSAFNVAIPSNDK